MNEVITWEAIDAELNKGEQMGYQTVLQLAKVGQMLVEKMGDTPIREFVQRAGQSIPRLTRSTCHNYMMLAKYRPLLEQRKPDSQRAALALIADSKAPPRATPAPTPATPQATPQQPEEPKESAEERTIKAEKEIEAIPDQFDLSTPMKVRYEKAVNRAVKVALSDLQAKFWDEVDKQVKQKLPDRIAHGEAHIERLAREYNLKLEALEIQREGIERIITEDEFKLIRGCLHSDRVPDDLKERFNRAFVILNKLAPRYDAMREAAKRIEERSERARAMWTKRKKAA